MNLRQDADLIIRESIQKVLPDEAVRQALNDKKFVSTFIGGLVCFIIFLITIVVLILCIIDKDNNINIILNRFTVNDNKLHIDHNTFPFAFTILSPSF